MDKRSILLCTDFSESSEPAKDRAVALAKTLGAPLVIVHVLDTWAGLAAYENSLPVDVRDVVVSVEEEAKLKLNSLARECQREVGQVETVCRLGVAAAEIVAAADENSAQLIVIGTHGWTGVKHLLLGSVAENVLRTANCPVLVVKPSPESIYSDTR